MIPSWSSSPCALRSDSHNFQYREIKNVVLERTV